MSRILFIAAAAAIVSSPAWATCFSDREAQADSALRYVATLRVTGLMCTGSAGSLYPDYQMFARNNARTLKTYDGVLQRHYGEAFHVHETEVQNDQSLEAARVGTAAFCRQHVPDLKSAILDSPAEVRRQIDDYAATHPAPVERCR